MASSQKYPQKTSDGVGAKNIPASKSKRRRNLTREIIPESSTKNGKAKLTSEVTRVSKASDDGQARERATKDRSSLHGSGVHSAALDASSTSSDAETTIVKCVATAMVMGAKTGVAKESGIITMKGLMATDKKSSESALPLKTKPRNMKMVVTAKVGGSREAVMKVDEINVNNETKNVTVKCDDKIVNETDVAGNSIKQSNSSAFDSDLNDDTEEEVMFFQCWSWYSTRPAAKYSLEDTNNPLLAPTQHDGSVSSLLETLGGNQKDSALSIHSAEATANDWLQRDDGDSHDVSDMTTIFQRKEENIKKWSTIMVADEYSEETSGTKRTDQWSITDKANTDFQTTLQNRWIDQENESENHSESTHVIRTSNIPVKTVSTTNKPEVVTRDQELKADVIKVDYEDVNNIAKSKTHEPKKTIGITTAAITELKGQALKATTEHVHPVKRSNIPIKTGESNRTTTAEDIADTGIVTKEVTSRSKNILTVMDTTQIDALRETRHESGDEHPISNVSKTVRTFENGRLSATGKAPSMNQTETKPRKEFVSKTREMIETRDVNMQEAVLIKTNASREQGDRLNSGVQNGTSNMKIPETTALPTSVSKGQDGRPKPGEKKDADKVQSEEAPEGNTGDVKVSKQQGGGVYSEEKLGISKVQITETSRADISLPKEQGARLNSLAKNDSSSAQIPETRSAATDVSKRQDSRPKSEERKDTPMAKTKEPDKEMTETKISKVKSKGATTVEMRVTSKVMTPQEGASNTNDLRLIDDRAKPGEMKHTTKTNITKASLVTSYSSTKKGGIPELVVKNDPPKEVNIPELHPSNIGVTPTKDDSTISKVKSISGERKGASKKNITDASLVTADVTQRYGKVLNPGVDNNPPKVKTLQTSLVTTNVSEEQCDGNESEEKKDTLSVKFPTVITTDVPVQQTGRSMPVERKDAHKVKIQEIPKGNPMVSKGSGDTKVFQVERDRPNPGEKMKITVTGRHGSTGSTEEGARSSAREKNKQPPGKISETRPVPTSVSKRQESRPKFEERKTVLGAKIKEAGKAKVSKENGDIKVSKIKGEGAKTEDRKATPTVKVPEAGATDTSVSTVTDDGAKPAETNCVPKTNITETSLVTSNISNRKGGIREPAEKNDTPKVKTSEIHIGNSSVTHARARGDTMIPKVGGDGANPGETKNNTQASLTSTNISKEHGKIPDLRRGNNPLKVKSQETRVIATNVTKGQSDNTKSGEKNNRSKIQFTDSKRDGISVSKEQVVRSNVKEKNESPSAKIPETRPVPCSISKEQNGGPTYGEKKVSNIYSEQGEKPEPVEHNIPRKVNTEEDTLITGFSKGEGDRVKAGEMKDTSIVKVMQAGPGNTNVIEEQGERKYSGEEGDGTEPRECTDAMRKNIPESGPGSTNIAKGQGNMMYSRVEADGTEPRVFKDASQRKILETCLVTSNISSQLGGIPAATKMNIPGATLDTTRISSEKSGIFIPVEKYIKPELKIPETYHGDTGLVRGDNIISKVKDDGAKSAGRKGAPNVNIPSFDVLTFDVEQVGRSKSGEKKNANKVKTQEARRDDATVSTEQRDRSNYGKEDGTSDMRIQEMTHMPTSVSKEQGVRSKAGEKNESPRAQIPEMRVVPTSVSKMQDSMPKSEERKDDGIVNTKDASPFDSRVTKEMSDTKVSKVPAEGAKTVGIKATSKVQECAGDTSVSGVIGFRAKPGVTKHTTKTNIPEASQVTPNMCREKGRTPESGEQKAHPGNTSATPARGDNRNSKVKGDRTEPGERRDASKRKIPGVSLDTSAISSQQDSIPEPVKKNSKLTGTAKEASLPNTEVSNIKRDGAEHGEIQATWTEGNKTRAMTSASAEGYPQHIQAHDGRSEMGGRRIVISEDRNDSSRMQILDDGEGNTTFSNFHDDILKSGKRDGAANLKIAEADLNNAPKFPNQGDRPYRRGRKDTQIGNTRTSHGERKDSAKRNIARTAHRTTPCGSRGAQKISPAVKYQVTRSGNAKESNVHVAKSKLGVRKYATKVKGLHVGVTNASQGHGGKSNTLKSIGSPNVMIPEAGADNIKDSQKQSHSLGKRKHTQIKLRTGIKKCAPHRMSRAMKGTGTRTAPGEGKPAKLISRKNHSGVDSRFRGWGTTSSAILTSSRGPVFFNVKWDGNSTMRDIFSWRPVTGTVSNQSIGEHEPSSGGTKHEKVSHADHYNCYCHPKCSCKFNEMCFCGKQAGHW